MAALTFPYDHSRDPMRPEHLAEQIGQAAGVTAPQVDIDATSITVNGAGIGPAKRAAIQQVISSYVFDPNWGRVKQALARVQAQCAAGIPLDLLGAAGDGTTDDTARAQAVLNGVGAGATVIAPWGKAFLTTGLTVPENVTLVLQGAAVKLKGGAVLPALTLQAGARVIGGLVDGNRAQVASSQARGILLAADGARVEGVEVANTYSHGIAIGDANFAYVDAYVHGTANIGIFAQPTVKDCRNLTIKGRVDRVAEGALIVGGGVQVYGEAFQFSDIKIAVDVDLPASPTDPNACCVIVLGRKRADVRAMTTGGQMGVTCDTIPQARVTAHVAGASLYGVELSNCQDFDAAVTVDGGGVTGSIANGAGVIANRGATGRMSPVVSGLLGGTPCVSVANAGDVAVDSPRLSATVQLPFVALFNSSGCSVSGGVLHDTSGLCNGLLIQSTTAPASDNTMVGTVLRGLGTVLRVLAVAAATNADRNHVSALTVNGATTGAFLQAAGGGTVTATKLGDSSLTAVTTKVQSAGATGTAVGGGWS